ncbi:neuronal acetylcholine receptor subunit alpha-7 isoform X2 [Alosa alosa]|uniref:neuronal acetylcholine receptor subunit alpha-7 isoform X2 n=1 Tax=Alosa alosa TaxID=278164 RepID=UPI002015058D|nr:neuronal acetylcholine receptor subunit alpha-7 isoform X2 [Alosa alosa]
MGNLKLAGFPVLGGILIWTSLCIRGTWQGQYQRKLYNDLLSNYNRLERPVQNDSAPIVVELGLTLLQIIDVDEKNQVLITNAWLQLYWTDIYLSWNVDEYPGVQNLRFPSNQIWVPDILLYNSADERFDATFHTNVLVNHSGACQYIPPDVPAKRNELYYECCKEPYPDVTFTVTMRRRTLYYALNLLIPCVLISGLALLVFLLPADSGEKISLGITVLLSLTVFMLLVAEIMPATSDSVPLIAQYFSSTMMIVGLSVVVTVLVLQFHHHDPQAGKMPKWVRVVLLNWCAWFLRMKKPGASRVRGAGGGGGCKYTPASPPLHSASSIQMGAIPGQPAGTNGHMNLYFGYHSMDEGCCPASSDSGVVCGRAAVSPNEEQDAPRTLSERSPELQRILEEVSYIAQRFREQDEGEAVCSEWKFAAAVVDRLCLVAFSLFSIICTFTILMSAPNFIEAVSKDFT